MIYIIWEDYDGTFVEEFPASAKAKAEKKIAEIARKEDDEEYGTRIVKIIAGEELSYKVTEKIDTVELVPIISVKPKGRGR